MIIGSRTDGKYHSLAGDSLGGDRNYCSHAGRLVFHVFYPFWGLLEHILWLILAGDVSRNVHIVDEYATAVLPRETTGSTYHCARMKASSWNVYWSCSGPGADQTFRSLSQVVQKLRKASIHSLQVRTLLLPISQVGLKHVDKPGPVTADIHFAALRSGKDKER